MKMISTNKKESNYSWWDTLNSSGCISRWERWMWWIAVFAGANSCSFFLPVLWEQAERWRLKDHFNDEQVCSWPTVRYHTQELITKKIRMTTILPVFSSASLATLEMTKQRRRFASTLEVVASTICLLLTLNANLWVPYWISGMAVFEFAKQTTSDEELLVFIGRRFTSLACRCFEMMKQWRSLLPELLEMVGQQFSSFVTLKLNANLQAETRADGFYSLSTK